MTLPKARAVRGTRSRGAGTRDMGPPLEVRSQHGTVTATVSLDPAVFGVQPNVPLMHQVVTAQLAAARAGVPRAPRPGPRFRAAGPSPTGRKAPAEPGRAARGPRTTPAVVWPWAKAAQLCAAHSTQDDPARPAGSSV